MEGSLQDGPPRRSGAWRTTLLAIAGLSISAVVVGVIVASGPNRDERGATVAQFGDLTWAATTVHRDGDGDARITASVELDGEAFPTATSRQDDRIAYQLAGGRFDTAQHTDDLEAERVLGFEADDVMQILPTEAARERTDAEAHPRSGEYTLSLDGDVEYRDIPSGTWELRAYVLDQGGNWDGQVATREITVRP